MLNRKLQRLKLKLALGSKQFWLVYIMACFSIVFGYYTLDVYKMDYYAAGTRFQQLGFPAPSFYESIMFDRYKGKLHTLSG